MTYTLFRAFDGELLPGHVVRDTDGKILVENPLDQEWQDYETWLKEGGVAAEPAPREPVSAPAVTFKADIWRRATDQEAEMLDTLLSSQPARMRNLYRDAQQIDHDDELFPVLLDAMTQAFGETRALELLAPIA